MTIETGAGGQRAGNATLEEERPLGPALKRGWRGGCPNCGERTLFSSFLTVSESCTNCREALHHH
ncbi:MAG: hypothetical protein AAF371_16625, partial [Pseudomonadota bacterium]